MLRYHLRTLLSVLALGPPMFALAWRAWLLIEWQTYLRPSVAARRIEWNAAKSRNDGSRREMAGERHAMLRYRREDAPLGKDLPYTACLFRLSHSVGRRLPMFRFTIRDVLWLMGWV